MLRRGTLYAGPVFGDKINHGLENFPLSPVPASMVLSLCSDPVLQEKI
jgi:hypothetical protein